jgi:hypothetical protein
MRREAPQTLRRHAPRTDLGFTRNRHLNMRKSGKPDLRRGIQYAVSLMQASARIKIVGEYWIARLRGQ